MEEMFEIGSFAEGINEYTAEALMKPSEAISALNCDISNGSLKSIKGVLTALTMDSEITNAMPFYTNSKNHLVLVSSGRLSVIHNGVPYATPSDVVSGHRMDSINFEYNGQKVLVCVSAYDDPIVLFENEGTVVSRRLKNRRKIYDEETGEISGYADANGVIKTNESEITTHAPKGSFLELHYDRLWIAGDNTNPDRLYFSTAGVNGADIEDWTVPIEEAEANQHGGFIDIRSYDGSKIIGLKVVFNAVVVFKEKSAYKIFGDNPENYEVVQLFSSNGAIADKSICVGNNGAYFLNNDGIYFYDGTNTNLISQKINKTIGTMNKNYSSLSCACFYNNKYYLAIPTGDSNRNNKLIIFDTLTNSFVIQELGGFLELYDFEGALQGTVGNKIVHLYRSEENLPLIWETPSYDYGKKNSRKNTNYIYFRGKGTGSVEFTLSSEKKTKVLTVPLTSVDTVYRKKLKVKGRLFKLTIKNTPGSYIEISNPQLSTEIDND